MVQNTSRASFGSFSGGRSTMAEKSTRSLGIMGRDIGRNSYRWLLQAHITLFRRLRQQRLPGLHAAEHNRLGRHHEALVVRPHDGVVGLRRGRGEILAV